VTAIHWALSRECDRDAFAEALEADGFVRVVDRPMRNDRPGEIAWKRGDAEILWTEHGMLGARLLTVSAEAARTSHVEALPRRTLAEVLRDAAAAEGPGGARATTWPRATAARGPSLVRAVGVAIALATADQTPLLAPLLDRAVATSEAAARLIAWAIAIVQRPALDTWLDAALARLPEGDDRRRSLGAVRERLARAGEFTDDLAGLDRENLRHALEQARAAGHHVRVVAAADLLLRDERVDVEVLAARALARAATGDRWGAFVDALAAAADLEDPGAIAEDLVGPLEDLVAGLRADRPSGPPPREALAILEALDGNPARSFAVLREVVDVAGIDRELDLELRFRYACAAIYMEETEIARDQARIVAAALPRSRYAAALVARLDRDEGLRTFYERFDGGSDPDFDPRFRKIAVAQMRNLAAEDLLRDLLRKRQAAGASGEELLAIAEKERSIAPDSALAWLDVGVMLTGVRRHADAVVAYTGAIDRLDRSDEILLSDVTFVWFNRACERAMCGEIDLAIDDLAEACRRDAQWVARAADEEYFDALRGDPRFEAILRGELPVDPARTDRWQEKNDAAKAATFRGDWEQAFALAKAALELATTPLEEAESATTLSFAACWSGDLEFAIESAEEAVALGADHGDRQILAESHHMLGVALHRAGDHEAAEREYESARALREEIHGPEHPSLAKSWGDLARLAADRGDGALAVDRTARGTAILAAFIESAEPGDERTEALADAMILGTNETLLRRRGGEFAAALAAAARAVRSYELFPGSTFSEQVLRGLLAELGQIVQGAPELQAAAQDLATRIERRFASGPAGRDVSTPWSRVIGELLRLRSTLGVEDAAMAPILRAAIRGEPPSPQVARVPGAAAALASFASLATAPGTTLPVMTPMAVELLGRGERGLEQTLDDLRVIGGG
jgi:tetratricopeptide (TPR) repeat protein